ncbi:hypothetical protein MFIFM68171_05037 [Madurella fahalii]|uniref:FAD-binding domain-containing protein n=1 Tax=Madurella fahalii TaxID=1157608 RepID=A0ABQ0GAN8_9PEZI
MTHECDVLIVGAGPVGTALALELALHHVSFRIIDQAPVRSDKSRSLVVQPRTLELLNRHGAVDTLIHRGRSIHGGSMYVGKQAAVGFDLDNLGIMGTKFPLPLNVSQAETERFLEECLSKYDISVQRPFTATEIVQDKDGVTTTLKTPDGKVDIIRAKYVVGCDGAHSVVRKAANLTFKGAPYPQDFILCDVHLRDSNLLQDHIGLHLGSKGVLALFPFDNEIIRLVASGYQITPDTKGEPTLEQFQTYFTATTPPGSGTLYDPIWIARFRLHHRGVNRYRDGRLFVAGDAAHIHSPAGGQGMNAGIQDAINLGWKLALALELLRDNGNKSTSSPSAARAEALLDSYDAERHPIGRALLKRTDRIFSFVSTANPFYVPIRNFVVRYVMPILARSAKRRHSFYQFISELGITYRGSSKIVGTAKGFRGPVRGGDRLPDGRLLLRVEGAEAARETTLHRVCVGRAHHFLLFAAGAEAGGSSAGKAPDKDQLVAAGEEVMRAFGSEIQVHYIQTGGVRLSSRAAEWYTDPEGSLHGRFGFGCPGYVLVRPDGYIAHIGPLAKLDQLISFLK